MDEATQGAFIFAGLLALGALVVWWDRVRHPKSKCSTCRGSGRLYSSLTDRWRDCNCSGGVRDRRAKN